MAAREPPTIGRMQNPIPHQWAILPIMFALILLASFPWRQSLKAKSSLASQSQFWQISAVSEVSTKMTKDLSGRATSEAASGILSEKAVRLLSGKEFDGVCFYYGCSSEIIPSATLHQSGKWNRDEKGSRRLTRL